MTDWKKLMHTADDVRAELKEIKPIHEAEEVLAQTKVLNKAAQERLQAAKREEYEASRAYHQTMANVRHAREALARLSNKRRNDLFDREMAALEVSETEENK